METSGACRALKKAEMMKSFISCNIEGQKDYNLSIDVWRPS